jgi:hypothetical protein
MNEHRHWLQRVGDGGSIEGLVSVVGYSRDGRPPEEVAVLEKASQHAADYVFFRSETSTQASIAEAFVYVDDENGARSNDWYAEQHRRLWSWGGVPLLYRRVAGRVDLLRCAHGPDFERKSGERVYHAFKTLELLADIDSAIASDPWWDATLVRSGALWDDPTACRSLLDGDKSAHRRLIQAIEDLDEELSLQDLLPKQIGRRLLVLTLLIAYLEDRKVLDAAFFCEIHVGALGFFDVLGHGASLVKLLDKLAIQFNGDVFLLSDEHREILQNTDRLEKFARLVEGRTDKGGQLTLWRLYSFQDLPVELISHVYQIFVKDNAEAVYTPPFLVRLMLDEVLGWQRLDRMAHRKEAVLDPACGSGVFLVEAYKRLILHWRYRHNWKTPNVATLRGLMRRVRGVDLEPGAIELAAFSLCLAMCEALDTRTLRNATKLFPELVGVSLYEDCFFKAMRDGTLGNDIGAVVGNPPFASKLSTAGAKASFQEYEAKHGTLPDKQVAYLFLHDCMRVLVPGGVLCLLQQYNFLYNEQSADFCLRFFGKWDVREILDFVSVRGLFPAADTKVVAVVAESQTPPSDRLLLHAVFRRTGRVVARQGFDIDYYDLHWISRQIVLDAGATGARIIWRCNLLGGGRVLEFAQRLRKMTTLVRYADDQHWNRGEGFIEGSRGVSNPAEHIIGKKLLPSNALAVGGVRRSAITVMKKKPIEGPRSEKRFTPPMLLVHEQMDLNHDVWEDSYLTYKNQIVGFCASEKSRLELVAVGRYLGSEKKALKAYVAATSIKLFTQHATTLSSADILSLPYPESHDLEQTENERIIVDDVVDFYRDLVRKGQDSRALLEDSSSGIASFNDVYARQINTIYGNLRPLVAYQWAGAVCQPFVFGDGEVDWKNVEQLQDKLDSLLRERTSPSLNTMRIARLYDGPFVFLLKPNRLRYWLRSIALRDADETVDELRTQGF